MGLETRYGETPRKSIICSPAADLLMDLENNDSSLFLPSFDFLLLLLKIHQ